MATWRQDISLWITTPRRRTQQCGRNSDQLISARPVMAQFWCKSDRWMITLIKAAHTLSATSNKSPWLAWWLRENHWLHMNQSKKWIWFWGGRNVYLFPTSSLEVAASPNEAGPAARLSLVKPAALVKPRLDWKPSTSIFLMNTRSCQPVRTTVPLWGKFERIHFFNIFCIL